MAYEKKGGNGGARPGAGRPRKEDKNAEAIGRAEELIKENWDEIVLGQIRLAVGVTVKEVDEDTGGVEIYSKPPDFKAGSYLMNHIIGTPVQRTKDEDAEDKISVYGQLIRELRTSRGLVEVEEVAPQPGSEDGNETTDGSGDGRR